MGDMAANDNRALPTTPSLELLLRSSVIKGELEALAASTDPQSAAVLEYAARVLRLLANPGDDRRAGATSR
jgi:hypothetical protein